MSRQHPRRAWCGVVAVLALIAAGHDDASGAPSNAARCAVLGSRLYGADGSGGEVARYRATTSSAERTRLSDAIVADGRSFRALHCPSPKISHAVAATPTGGESVVGASAGLPTVPPGANGVTLTVRSVHGCVGFNGTWSTQTGVLRIRAGSGTLGSTSFRGTVSGNVMRGTWNDATIGRGTFVFALADDGDSIDASFKNVNGANGAYTAECVAP